MHAPVVLTRSKSPRDASNRDTSTQANASVKPAVVAVPVASLASSPLRIVIVGHVDHGKSTLIGRLFHDTGSLPDGKLESIQASCDRRGVPFEWAFLMDAFKAERDQNITIDTAQIWFKTETRPYVIIDAPGHREFLKNMVTGAASADAAVLVVAADEGVCDQSRRHAFLLSLLGVRQVLVVVNKIDLVPDPTETFAAIESELGTFLAGLGVTPKRFLPVSARDGDNVVTATERTAFWNGPSLVEALDELERPLPATDTALRFPIQDIYRFDHRRIIAGRVESGHLHVGDELVFSPGGRRARVESIESWSRSPLADAAAGQSVAITLDEQLFLERGQVGARVGQVRPEESNRVRARVFWMGKRPLRQGQPVRIKCVTQEAQATVERVEVVLDASSLERRVDADALDRDEVGEVILKFDRVLALDIAEDIASTGRFVLVDDFDVAGGGLVLEALPADIVAPSVDEVPRVALGRVSSTARAAALGHRSGEVWVQAGPHTSSESAAAFAVGLERALFDRGVHAVAFLQPRPMEATALRAAGVVVISVVRVDVAPPEVDFLFRVHDRSLGRAAHGLKLDDRELDIELEDGDAIAIELASKFSTTGGQKAGAE